MSAEVKTPWRPPAESIYMRFGSVSMLARLYLLTGRPDERRELVRALNAEFDPSFYHPIPEEE